MRRGSFWDCTDGQLLGGVELVGNSWLSATSRRSDLYLIFDLFSKQKATCNFSREFGCVLATVHVTICRLLATCV
jgi:hypothetical protein